MNERIAAASAAAAAVGGAVVVIVPQHAVSIARLLAAAVAVVVGGLVLLAVVPVAARRPRETALDRRPSPGPVPLDPPGLRDARRDLARPSRPGALPEPVRRRLVVAAALALHDVGIDLHDPHHHDRAEQVLGTDTWRRLRDEQLAHAPGSTVAPAAAAATVNRFFDQFDHLQPQGAAHVHR